MNSTDFRNALGAFTTGVCLITVDDPKSGPLALTANSFSSLSLTPPLVLWNIQNDSDCFREYTECLHFGISILCADQQALSGCYARKDNHKIVENDFIVDEYGVSNHLSCPCLDLAHVVMEQVYLVRFLNSKARTILCSHLRKFLGNFCMLDTAR